MLKDMVFERWLGQGCEERSDTLKMVSWLIGAGCLGLAVIPAGVGFMVLIVGGWHDMPGQSRCNHSRVSQFVLWWAP